MTSIVEAPRLNKDEPLPAWMKIDWSPEVLHDIYRDWGIYYSRRRRENFAMHYLNKALDLEPLDHMTLYQRCQTKRKAAQMLGALSDSREAAKLAKRVTGEPNALINLDICDVLYELNQFENSKAEMHNNVRVFSGNKRKNFDQRLLVVDEVIKDVTGEAMTNFFSKNTKTVNIVNDLMKEKQKIDTRPLWKVLKEQGKCDVQSIPEIEEVQLSPMEIARRKRAFNIFHQSYINDSWVDVLFMKMLCKNPTLLLPQCKESTYILYQISRKQYEIVRKFMKMLQSRSPLYLVNFLKYRNKAMSDRYREAYLFRVQYQTHRNMNKVLKQIRVLRRHRRVKQLTKFVEEVMGDYVVLKTSRVMCWKFEFLNEVYNTLALALSEQLRVPKNLVLGTSAILTLLRLPKDKVKDFVSLVFGDRSTHPDPDHTDPKAARAKKLTARLEHRMIFAKYSIEKCYLLHQISQSHLDQGRHSECVFNARKAIKESKNCNSNLWKFLSIIQIVKANAVLHKLEQTKEALEEALPLARELDSPELVHFTEACMSCNNEDAITKRATLMQSRRESRTESLAHSLGSREGDTESKSKGSQEKLA
ncbi:uncharacterized protein [Drosophila bipectinata]|uniref:uncharacterized protein n=1 Tax=Drosophila bipectinata TaxID=42026 RepID=UPI0007E72C0A|nr:uncharacterized protein LOC108123017 [Drosophila bipectinata]KAH8279302.1 hypothetical protein KR026_005871 [Drosophila bipectinata]